MSLIRAALLLSLVACDVISVKSSSDDDDSDSGYTPASGPGDDDADTDCDVSYDAAPISGDDCVTETLSCGDSLDATTDGGLKEISGPALQSWFCTIASDNDYVGAERVYEFIHPGDTNVATGSFSEAIVTLDEPCGGLELFVMAWADDTCPVDGMGVLQCDEASGTGEIIIYDNEVRRYLIIVDGADQPLPFTVGIDCPT